MSVDAGDDGRPWLAQPAAAMDLDLDHRPYPFDQRRRDPIAAAATVEFSEMLCQLDRRFDALLPEDWPLDGYVFALMDALRAEYASAYTVHREVRSTPKGNIPLTVAPNVSRAQIIFWQDEDSAYRMVRDYLDSAPARDAPPVDYTRHTAARRGREDALGLRPAEYYPYPPSASSQADTDPLDDQPEDEDTYGAQDLFSQLADQMTAQMAGPAGEGPSIEGEGDEGPIDWEGEDDGEEI